MPEDEFLGEEDAQTLCDALGELGSAALEHAAHMREALQATSSRELRVAYAARFMGPFRVPAPPYGSVYLEEGRRLLGDSTIDVITRYREAGVEIAPDQKDVPDHIAIELEFLAYLISMEIEAGEGEDAQTARAALASQRSFLQDHLAAWVPKFVEATKANCEPNPFYDALAECTESFVTEDLRRVNEATLT